MRGILFDVGGPIDTEVISERLVDRDIRAALEAEGVRVTGAAYAGAAAGAVQSFAPNAYTAIIWSLAKDRETAIRAHDRFQRGSEQRLAERGGIELRPGIDALLRELHGRGIVLGLAANQPRAMLGELDRLGLGQFFGHREMTGHHGLRKPDPRLFLRACDALGLEPHECVMIGDRVDNDIAPAKRLGMAAVLLRSGRHAAQRPRWWGETPDAEVKDVAGLRVALEALTRRD
jgi:HAD superfamily hydrolase (TIGR01662 family)